MLNRSFLFFFFQLVSASLLATEIANYRISVSLDPSRKSLQGEQMLEWTNTSEVEVKELQFHLYLNAFRDANSTFMKESGGRLRSDVMDSEGFGNIYITSIKTSSGTSLLRSLKFIQSDDQNRDDRTVASLLLPEPVQPGKTIRLNMEFKAKLPKVFARTGWGRDNFFMVGQWFPKIGVFEKNENGNWGWNCHQFHANTEFYADFGKYHVQIRLPEEYKVGATGVQTSEIRLKGGLKLLTFEADQVHDFAWTASPHYLIFETVHRGIRLRAFMQPEHASQHTRYFDAVKKAIDYYTKTLGKYPYETLTLVDPPFHSSGAGGMEYPTLITCGS